MTAGPHALSNIRKGGEAFKMPERWICKEKVARESQ